jgi:hypothetical protein
MRSPALAIAWQLFARYRVWIAVGSVYFIFAAVFCQLLPQSQTFMNIRHALALPLVFAPLGLMALFVFGSEIDIAGRESSFPEKMFTLPVRTSMLVVWPMTLGALTTGAVCVAITWLVLRPSGFVFSPWWPPVLAATCLAWVQTVAWLPFGVPWMRIPVLAISVGIQGLLVELGYMCGISEPFILLMMIAQIPVAGSLAIAGISRARCGENPDWRLHPVCLARLLCNPSGYKQPFKSAFHAQFWLEWRLNGKVFPIVMALTTPIVAAGIMIGQLNPNKIRNDFLQSPLILLVLPLFLGYFCNGHWGKFIASRKDREPSAFLSIRPISCAAMVAIKLKAAAASVAVGCLIAGIMMLAVSLLSGTLMESARQWTSITHSPSLFHAVAAAFVAIALIVFCTWRLSVENMFIILSGRNWLVVLFFAAIITALLAVVLAAQWIHLNREYQALLRESVPYAVWTLLAIKLLLAIWIFAALRRRRLLAGSDMAYVLGFWILGVVCLCGILCWLIPNSLVPWYMMAPCAVIAVPLVRIILAPLALAWNRHR